MTVLNVVLVWNYWYIKLKLTKMYHLTHVLFFKLGFHTRFTEYDILLLSLWLYQWLPRTNIFKFLIHKNIFCLKWWPFYCFWIASFISLMNNFNGRLSLNKISLRLTSRSYTFLLYHVSQFCKNPIIINYNYLLIKSKVHFKDTLHKKH